MKSIDRLALVPHKGPYESWGGVSHLIIDGSRSDQTVPGYQLLRQYSLENGYLLLLDYDCPFEESVVAVRLDANFQVVAKEHFGFMYTSWWLHDAVIHGPMTLDICFGGDPPDWWRLTLKPNGKSIRSKKITRKD